METEMTDDEEIDPRIKGELDVLNQSTDAINKLETELSEQRAIFKNTIRNAIERLESLSKKYGKSIERARPYYEVKQELAQAQHALQRAVHNFQCANGVHRAAKETISLAENRLREFADKKVDMAWQEMLNLQTVRLMEAEKNRSRSEHLHCQATKKYEYIEKKMQGIGKRHRKSTKKTRPYFELKELLEADLQKKRKKVEELQTNVDIFKKRYRQGLDNLERISVEIHEKRKQCTKDALSNLQMATLISETDLEPESAFDDEELARNMHLDIIGPKYSENDEDLEKELNDFIPDESNTEEDNGFSSESENSEVDYVESPRLQTGIAEAWNGTPGNMLSVNRTVMTSIEEDQEISDIREKNNTIYSGLHGTNVDSQENARPNLPSHIQSKDFDIFDDLC